MARFKLSKVASGSISFSIVREDGATISFELADDGCGKFKDEYVRGSLLLFDKDNSLFGGTHAVTPVEYLHELAEFLGYNLKEE